MLKDACGGSRGATPAQGFDNVVVVFFKIYFLFENILN
jgi:hypothetical protein